MKNIAYVAKNHECVHKEKTDIDEHIITNSALSESSMSKQTIPKMQTNPQTNPQTHVDQCDARAKSIFAKRDILTKRKTYNMCQTEQNTDLLNENNHRKFPTRDCDTNSIGKPYNNSAKRYNINSLSDSDDELEEEQCENLTLQEIISSIPQSATKVPNIELQKTHTEWRWRFFDLRGRKLIEISKISPNDSRMYKDYKGNWIKHNLEQEWDNFLTDSRYCYAKT